MSGIFRFKQFEVRNELSAMKVGTDGVLLGAWTTITGEESRILDVGTGTGVIALMLAQRCQSAIIEAIDIDLPSVDEATANFAASPWADRLYAVNVPLQQFTGHRYDLIVSNPPFFVNSLRSPDARRSDARHSDTLQSKDIISSALRLLSPSGRLALILPSDVADSFRAEALQSGLSLSRLCRVCTTPSSAPRRHLMEFALHSSPEPEHDAHSSLWQLSRSNSSPSIEHIVIQDAGGFTHEYRSLTGEFYLKF